MLPSYLLQALEAGCIPIVLTIEGRTPTIATGSTWQAAALVHDVAALDRLSARLSAMGESQTWRLQRAAVGVLAQLSYARGAGTRAWDVILQVGSQHLVRVQRRSQGAVFKRV